MKTVVLSLDFFFLQDLLKTIMPEINIELNVYFYTATLFATNTNSSCRKNLQELSLPYIKAYLNSEEQI